MTPSLVIVGSKDKYSKNESLIKSQSNVQVIDGGHNFLWENPEATIKVIDNFLGI
jgi:pimeloyl-ACP methyl ester carboxylesterase